MDEMESKERAERQTKAANLAANLEHLYAKRRRLEESIERVRIDLAVHIEALKEDERLRKAIDAERAERRASYEVAECMGQSVGVRL
jgi:excinuclease UvrABC helicase subunit UvrB